jgi:methyl-accepting chemotaxis protein
MLQNSLRVRLLLPVLALVLIAVVATTILLAIFEAGRVRSEADAAIGRQTRSLQSLLGVTRSIMLDRTHDEMRLLRQRGEALGPAKQGAMITAGQRQAPDLLFGGKPQGNVFGLADGVVDIMGGTVTLFSKAGEDFVRISTNVKKDDGTRAVGTQLDPNGPVIVEMRKSLPFYGIVDILGHPYVTGYEPMFDESRNVIGIWYVGYKTDLEPLDAVIGSSKAMDSGFFALFDSKGKLRFQSRTGAGADTIQKIAADPPADWTVKREDVPGWGFSLVSAYPKSDINRIVWWQSLWIGGFGLVLCLLLLGLQSALIWNRVLQPIQSLTAVANDLSLGKPVAAIPETELKDEIGTLAKAVARLSNSVRLAMERLAKR